MRSLFQVAPLVRDEVKHDEHDATTGPKSHDLGRVAFPQSRDALACNNAVHTFQRETVRARLVVGEEDIADRSETNTGAASDTQLARLSSSRVTEVWGLHKG